MNETKEATLTKQQRYWLAQIQACEAAGKTIAAYAKEQWIEAKTMYAGKKVLIDKGVLSPTRPGRFQRVQVPNVTVGSEWRIQLPNGVSVAFAGLVDTQILRTVLNTAAALE
jgi:hypothetical protein